MRSIVIAVLTLPLLLSNPLWGQDQGADQSGGAMQFNLDFLKGMETEKGNLFFSPFSIRSALAMVYEGARGETRKQIASVFRFAENGEEHQKRMGDLRREVLDPRADDPNVLVVANGLWPQQDYRFEKEFVRCLEEVYGARTQPLDFAGNAEKARIVINDWVEEKTRDLIQDLLPPGSVGPLTRMVLTNAVYFKGQWDSPFKKKNTRTAPFFAEGEKRREVQMMGQTDRFPYLEEPAFQVLELPYAGKTFSMVIFLPRERGGLAALSRELNAQNLNRWLGAMRAQEVNLSLPRFESTFEIELNGLLAKMGMPMAFSEVADFSGMDGKRDLYLSKVLHKAFIEVNEEGTEAAAATGAVMALTSMTKPITFVADHPFIYLILHRATSTVLFMGRLSEP